MLNGHNIVIATSRHRIVLTSNRSMILHSCRVSTRYSKGEFLYHRSPAPYITTRRAAATDVWETYRSNGGNEHFANRGHAGPHLLPVARGAAVRKTVRGEVPACKFTIEVRANDHSLQNTIRVSSIKTSAYSLLVI